MEIPKNNRLPDVIGMDNIRRESVSTDRSLEIETVCSAVQNISVPPPKLTTHVSISIDEESTTSNANRFLRTFARGKYDLV